MVASIVTYNYASGTKAGLSICRAVARSTTLAGIRGLILDFQKHRKKQTKLISSVNSVLSSSPFPDRTDNWLSGDPICKKPNAYLVPVVFANHHILFYYRAMKIHIKCVCFG